MARTTVREPGPPRVGEAAGVLGALLQSDLLPLCVIRDGRLAYGNPAFARTFSLPMPTDSVPFTDLVASEDQAAVSERLAAIATGATPAARFGFHGLLPDGSVRSVEFFGARAPGNGGQEIVSLILDVTGAQRAQAQLSSLAFTDTLTGLSNRAQFFDRLRDALVAAQAAGTPFAVLIGDLDGFKEVNDRHGHEAGDLVLQKVASQLRAASRSNDTVARLGGDEFAMVLPSIATPEHAALVAGRVVRSVAEPVDIDGHEVTVGVSVGIALHPAHGADMDRLVHAADSAMYAAKREGKGRFVIATVDDGNGSMPVLRFVNWDDSALVGVGEIDEQHQRLVELINALGEDLKSIQPRERVQATLEELVRFTREHFEAEERLLEAYAPDQLERHRRSHRRLLEDLESLASGVDGQSMALTMRYLQDWLFAHIDAADRPLAQALNARGIR